MFAKPFNFILVYVVTVFNMTILVSPLVAILIPFIDRRRLTLNISGSMLSQLEMAFFWVIFLVSFFMLCYLFLDMVFGFSVRSSLKNCKRFEKMKDYDFLSNIFDEVKDKFAQKDVKLYIKNSDEVNAFAVASFGRRSVVLTSGIINRYLEESDSPREFLFAIRSILGHEMSHLINKDFLPTYLIIANQKATNFMSWFLNLFFGYAVRFSSIMPLGGRFMGELMIGVYGVLNFVLSSFNRYIVYNVYEFLRKFSSRSIEFRCDKQSALAFGGPNMAFALSFLGESGYFTLFSTHPGTRKRIEKVKYIDLEDKIIRPSFIDSFSNWLTMMIIFVICMAFAKLASVDLLIRQYIYRHEEINHKIHFFLMFIKDFCLKLF